MRKTIKISLTPSAKKRYHQAITVNNPSPVTALQILYNMEPNTHKLFYHEGTMSNIIYYLYSKYTERGLTEKKKNEMMQEKILRLSQSGIKNPFDKSSNPSKRVSMTASGIRMYLRCGAVLKDSRTISKLIPDEILEVIDQ